LPPARVGSFGAGGRVSGHFDSGGALAAAVNTIRQSDAPSPIWDAVHDLPSLFRSSEGAQPVVFILTDGLGTANRYSHSEAVASVRDSSVMVYTAATRAGLDANDRAALSLAPRAALRAVSDATGARLFESHESASRLVNELFDDLAALYTIEIGSLEVAAPFPKIQATRGAGLVVRWVSGQPKRAPGQ